MPHFKNNSAGLLFVLILLIASSSFKHADKEATYNELFKNRLDAFINKQNELITLIQENPIEDPKVQEEIGDRIDENRLHIKGLDFWLRYLDPVSYKKINGPLPVEWETEVFEKFEKPYRREGSGYTLVKLYLEEPDIKKDSLLHLIQTSCKFSKVYFNDTILTVLNTPDHFYFCNRLFLLNLASMYTTGFDCPDTKRIVPELKHMINEVQDIYVQFNRSFPKYSLTDTYAQLYNACVAFINEQPDDYSRFNHYDFIRNYINPLFALNQKLITEFKIRSGSTLDYSLNNTATSIFSKSLYHAQNAKGVYLRVYDLQALQEIENLGKSLFYDPILSSNNRRSCASCHKPEQYFTDTIVKTSLQLNSSNSLDRNSPSLINAQYNHLVMLDGKHLSLQEQIKAVVSNSTEMGENPENALKKVLACKDYKKSFKKLLKLTPAEKEINFNHLASAITYYYSRSGLSYSPFDRAMNKEIELTEKEKQGFNLFMGKAQCGTCHFVPQFNGVKPPYVGSEFEVLGVPEDTTYKALSKDQGRYIVNPAFETERAFRTATIRNSSRTKPYMHNGVFTSMEQVIEFYNGGGGAGRKLNIGNQTLSADSLGLNAEEKNNILLFIKSLNEDVQVEKAPEKLPVSKNNNFNKRKVGGEY